MKYSDRFNNDYEFYLYNIDKLDFCGSIVDEVDKGETDVKKAFFLWDSQGKYTSCKDPSLLKKLMITKKSVNLHIKMWAEGRLELTLPKYDWIDIQNEFKLPEWAVKSCDNQMIKIYKSKGLSMEADFHTKKHLI